MRGLPGVVIFLLFAASTVTVAQSPLTLPAGAQAEAKSIDAERIRAHVKYLASDKLEGRGPGQPGGVLAAEYLAGEFKKYGLQPGAPNESFLQPVPLVGIQTIAAQTTFSLVPKSGPAIPLRFADDFTVTNQEHTASADVDAPIVFVGHGIIAPEFGWNDYAGVDMHGKVALIVVNEPPSTDPKFFNGAALTYYGRWIYKFEEAARQGAVGALIIHRADLASYGWEVVRNSNTGEKSQLRDDTRPKLKAAAWIQLEVADKLLSSAGITGSQAIAASDQRGFKAVALPVSLKAHVASTIRDYDSANVIARLPGAQAGGAVLYTAHYDHFGIDRKLKGDPIYHGAADNATGCGILLEMARAFAEKKATPPHTVYFVSVTAEEQGLLGSEYLGLHPPVPARDLSLDLNYDDIMPVGETKSTSVAGAERTTVFPLLQRLASKDGLAIDEDPAPGAGHYYRSDHFSLARVGIPAFSIGAGSLYEGHDRAWGKQQEETYVAERYHKPADVYSEQMDFRSDATLARFGFELGWLSMQQPAAVAWLPGDEFEAARKRSQQ